MSSSEASISIDNHNLSDICQLDGNETICNESEQEDCNEGQKIPVIITQNRTRTKLNSEVRVPIRKTLKRNNAFLQGLELPVVLNINPRSLYNKADDMRLLLEQYSGDTIFISESWSRENLPLDNLLQLDKFKIITNVKQRNFQGGKPALIINEEKYHIKELCPEPITVPIGVEAVWALITPKQKNHQTPVKYIALCALYYRGPKSTTKQELFDHIASTYHFLCSKYGHGIDFIIAGDTNRLNLSPILNLSPNLHQVVKVPTRLNPDRTLDPIITTLRKYYCEPITKPPVNADVGKAGKPSDHLVVMMTPITATQQIQPRVFKKIETRPIKFAGLQKFAKWIENFNWYELYESVDPNHKAEIFQNTLLVKYHECFPVKIMKISCDDKPWFNLELKKLDRKRKKEFSRHYKSDLWSTLNEEFLEKCLKAKESYYKLMVSDLKESNPGKWHSKLKRMSGQEIDKQENILVEELSGYSNKEQANMIAEHYADISNQYQPIKKDDFPQYRSNFPHQ